MLGVTGQRREEMNSNGESSACAGLSVLLGLVARYVAFLRRLENDVIASMGEF